ncbi:MAG: hydroxymethylbilane synthase, partial [Thermacetogeniaceae bacterium]
KRNSLDTLPAGSRIGTSSLRRAAQIRRLYPLLEVTDIRGNLDTRLRKLDQGQVDALMLAAAGLERIGWPSDDFLTIDPEICLPAPGQGALAIEIRSDDTLMRQICSEALEDRSARLAVTAERAFLLGLGGGCQVPVGALAMVRDHLLTLQGIVIQVDGQNWLSGQAVVNPSEAFDAGIDLANRLLDQGAKEILEGGR